MWVGDKGAFRFGEDSLPRSGQDQGSCHVYLEEPEPWSDESPNISLRLCFTRDSFDAFCMDNGMLPRLIARQRTLF